MKRKLSALLVFVLLFSMASCSRYKVEKGMKFFGHIPSMNLGIQTNDTVFSPDHVQLDIYYGWGSGFMSDTRGGYETVGAVIFAYDGRSYCSSILSVELDDYTNLEAVKPDTYYILKVITKNLDDEKYVCSVDKYGKADYGTHELLHIPQEVLTEPSRGFNIAIALVCRSIESGKYVYLYTEKMSLDFVILDNGNIQLIEH